MAIEIMLPAPRRQAATQAKVIHHVWKPLPAKPVIGLIDNAKAHTAELFDFLGKKLVERGVAGDYFVWQKRSAGLAATESERAAMLARAHVIVSGMGD